MRHGPAGTREERAEGEWIIAAAETVINPFLAEEKRRKNAASEEDNDQKLKKAIRIERSVMNKARLDWVMSGLNQHALTKAEDHFLKLSRQISIETRRSQNIRKKGWNSFTGRSHN